MCKGCSCGDDKGGNGDKGDEGQNMKIVVNLLIRKGCETPSPCVEYTALGCFPSPQ